ncbi:MAG: hypothetical protein HKO05_01905 [Erythrobacter sp.]|nr:hypothetical protein [Erythrobacter sp.]
MRRRFGSRGRGRRTKSWLVWLATAVMLAATLWLTGRPTARGDAISIEHRWKICGERRSAACVIDGDTVAIGKRRIRLTGYDSPELDGACAEESARARDARALLADWLNRGPVMVDGGNNPPRDRYGRELRAARRITPDGEEWLADWMIERGVAEGDGWIAAHINWCV